MLHLLRHLDPLSKTFDLSIWHDDPINPGQPWKTYIESRIHHTDIFLLLLSDNFMNSKFIGQDEFKAIIDRHKENSSAVIPVIINNCQWDIDLKFSDGEFNLNELQVLPGEGKPIQDWNLTEEAYDNIAADLDKTIRLFAEKRDQKEAKKDLDQLNIPFTEETETNKMDEEKNKLEDEIDEKKQAEEEENRLWEEAEAKRRAEVAKRIKEQAEASARRRAEEDKLWEEALARRRAEMETRILEEAETPADGRAEEEQGAKKTAAAVKRSGEERRFKKELQTGSHALEENKAKPVAATDGKVEDTRQEKNTNIKKRVLVGSVLAFFAIIVIWIFSISNSNSEKPLPTSPDTQTAIENSSDASANSKIDSSSNDDSFSKLEVGDSFDGGIIFSINQAAKTGKIAHLKDAGPMPWKNAMEIHEQLGEGWRLPTLDELEIMYQTIGQGAANNGLFTNSLYWSATPYDEYQARLLRFWDGNTSYHYNKSAEHRKFRVRAVRDFKL